MSATVGPALPIVQPAGSDQAARPNDLYCDQQRANVTDAMEPLPASALFTLIDHSLMLNERLFVCKLASTRISDD